MKNKKSIIIASTIFAFVLVFVAFSVAHADDNETQVAPVIPTTKVAHVVPTTKVAPVIPTTFAPSSNDSEDDYESDDNQKEFPEREMKDRINSLGIKGNLRKAIEDRMDSHGIKGNLRKEIEDRMDSHGIDKTNREVEDSQNNRNIKESEDNRQEDGDKMMEGTKEDSNQGEMDEHEKMSLERRSNVAKAVQEILKVTMENKNIVSKKGIGQEVKTIALKQVLNQNAIEKSLNEVNSRGRFITFFIGPKYSLINQASKLVKNNLEQINKLSDIGTQIKNKIDAQKIADQVKVLKTSSQQVEKYIKQSEGTFSLFGWLAKIFTR